MADTTAPILPLHAWDSHIHVIDPDEFPLSPDRDYTPKTASSSQAAAFEASQGIAHPVIVQPSVYGTDNTALLAALAHFHGAARGVCVVDPATIDDATLQSFHEAGVRGLRVNFGNGGTDEQILAAVRAHAAVARRLNWVLQLWIPLRAFVALHPVIPSLGVRVVADHLAHAEVGSKTGAARDTLDPYANPGFAEVVDLLRRRLLFVKISALYQNSRQAPLYGDMRVVAETLMLNGPEMVVYGSDWPHTGSKEGNAVSGGRLVPQDYRVIDDAGILEQIKGWAGSQAQVQRLFVDNPRRLWGWEELDS